MANSIWQKLLGTSNTSFGIGFAGPLLKANGSALEVWDPTGSSALQVVRGADPVGDTDLATKKYVDNLAKPIPAQQYNGGSSLLANSSTEQWFVVTTAGTGAAAGYTVGTVLWDDGSNSGNVTIITPTVGYAILTVGTFSSGTITLLTNTIYTWNGTAWVVLSTAAPAGVEQVIKITIGTSTAASTATIPSGAIITKSYINVTTPYSGGATISLGQTGSVSSIMDTGGVDPQANGLYVEESQVAASGSNLPVLATVSGSPGAGAAVALVWYVTPQT